MNPLHAWAAGATAMHRERLTIGGFSLTGPFGVRAAIRRRIRNELSDGRPWRTDRLVPPTRPRWLNRWWAWLGGYFWIPCPRCGRMFGGHEWAGTDWEAPGHDGHAPMYGSATCHYCPGERTRVDGEWREGHWSYVDGELVAFLL